MINEVILPINAYVKYPKEICERLENELPNILNIIFLNQYTSVKFIEDTMNAGSVMNQLVKIIDGVADDVRPDYNNDIPFLATKDMIVVYHDNGNYYIIKVEHDNYVKLTYGGKIEEDLSITIIDNNVSEHVIHYNDYMNKNFRGYCK